MSNEIKENSKRVREVLTQRNETKVKTPRDKYKSKGVRGVLVNLDLDTAEKFYELAKARGSKPTKVARELMVEWVKNSSL